MLGSGQLVVRKLKFVIADQKGVDLVLVGGVVMESRREYTKMQFIPNIHT